MKKFIVTVLLSVVSITIQAQYAIYSRIILPKLEIKDKQLLTQLDSILFVKYPCPYKDERVSYTYFVNIEEGTHNNYTISIVYAQPSEIENEINTGIFKIERKELIIRENSQRPLFTLTGEKDRFLYKKELMKREGNNYELIEKIAPARFCTWFLSYSENRLNILELGRD